MVSASLFEATDCACSALACNCFQFSCCLPTAELALSSSSFGTVDNSSWMERLGNVNTSIKFRDLILIGAHDAGSFSFRSHQPYSAMAKRQNINTQQQLHAGVRILDVRLATSKSAPSKLAIWRGCVQGGDLVKTVLQPVKDFVDRHPQEVVVLQLVPEHSRPFASDDKKRALRIVKEALGSRIIHGGHMSQLLQSWTLGDLRTKPGARVVVLVHNRFFSKITSDPKLTETSILEDYGFAPMDKWLRCLWFNTRNKETLMEYALEDVTRYGRQKRQFHASQLVLTPGVGSLADVVAALMGINQLRPASLAYRLYGDLGSYFRQHANQGWNWVLLDFVDLGPWIIHFLTALNFPVSLKLHVAAYQSEESRRRGKPGRNVTMQIQACVCRSRVLYVDSCQQVLGLSPDARGTLTLVYTLGKVTQTAALHVDNSAHGQAVLLSGYGHSCPEDSITVLPPDRSQGYIHNGSVLSEKANVSTLKGTVLEFSNVDGVFSCELYAPKNMSRGLDRRAVPTQIRTTTSSAQSKPKLLVLISKQSFDRSAIQNQQNTVTILDAKGIYYETLDGADPANKQARNELFTLSNLRGKYPQFFLIHKDGSKTFWGDFESFQNANESESLQAEFRLKAESKDRSIAIPETSGATQSSKVSLLVLISQRSFDRGVAQNQQKVITVLEAKGIQFTTLDGADPSNKEARNELFELSQKRGKYPQFFLMKNGTKEYWGDMETFQNANDDGSLAAEFGGRTVSQLATGTPFSQSSASATSQILVLISQQSFNRGAVQNQQIALSVLQAKGIPYATLDGADQANRDIRNELFKLSGLRGEYPQFFMIQSNGNKAFWGAYGAFAAANDNGTLEQDMKQLFA